jgi:ABC-2 type transport system ATP-binding protein
VGGSSLLNEALVLEARELVKTYGKRTVVDGMSIRLQPGEIVGLLGPNGAGKSTTVAMLCALVAPSHGGLRLDGHDVDSASPAGQAALKSRIGLVPQDLAIFEDLSARHNLELFGALYGLQGVLLGERVASALDLVGLADRAGDKPATFSGGMKRRLNIACALVHDPDILLFDEPTVGVDPQSRNAIFDNLEALRQRGKALLYTTHYMEEAERLCDRVVIMDHGRVVAEGTVRALVRELPSQGSLEVGLDGSIEPAALTALAAVPGVHQAEGVPGGVRLGLVDLARAGAALAWLGERGHAVRSLHSQSAGLEAVFLALTGRHLRD